MKKVLLIEDRSVRQKFFIDETNINLENYSDVLDNITDVLYDELELQIENNNFNLEKYDYIMSHKSIGEENKKFGLADKLKDYCKRYNKTLVLFSGGISANYYDTSEFEILELNSKTFYSKNLELFLEAVKNNDENTLMLCYGKKWKQNIVSNIIEKINIFIDRNDNEDIDYVEFTKYVDVKILETINDNIYTVLTEDGWIFLGEIIKLRDSLYECINRTYAINTEETTDTPKTILIHNNNIVDLQQFPNRIKFTPNVSEIDEYISKSIIAELKEKEFDVIYIKDNLSFNYLDLYGIRLAYHIRLSQELEDKKYMPIVILSDFRSGELNKIEPMTNILFTKGIFLIVNTKESIEKIKTMNFRNLTLEEYQVKFLDQVKIEQPKDYLTHHSIANEWSMYRWAEYLDVNSPDIEKIRDDISSMLYFKYLQAKFPIKRNLFKKNKREIVGKGKILYIDDEWEKGWKSIFEHLSPENKYYSLETVEEIYKDKSQEKVIEFIMEKVFSVDPDVIILDMRLHEDDFLDNTGLADFTGIQIFNKIKEINPGIQVIIFTASSNSLLLDDLNSYDSSILGYVKKEHPKNYNLTTQGNINKLINLINIGLQRKYLKDIFTISNDITNILNKDPFSKYDKLDFNIYEEYLKQLEKKAKYIFDILDSNLENRFNYAMISITTSLESVVNIFLTQRNNDDSLYFWDKKQTYLRKSATLENKIKKIIKDRLGYTDNLELSQLILNRNGYIHSNSKYTNVSSTQILEWTQTLMVVMEIIDKPLNYHPFDFEVESKKPKVIKDLRKK